jgi:two-component system, OmpR family, sensor kinase
MDDTGGASLKSLRGRLLAWLLGLLTIVGLLAGFLAYYLDRLEVDGSLDTQLRQIVLNIGDTRAPRAGTDNGPAVDPEDVFVVTIWDADGVSRSSDPSIAFPRPRATGYSDSTASGEEWRTYALVGTNRTVQAAQRVVVRDEFAANSAVRAVLPILILIPLSWLLVGWVVGRALRPMRRVTAELRKRDHANAADQLSLVGVPDEILPLVLAMNDVIVRLRGQIEFRQKFISDAAHELRTPLTALRLQAGNLRGRALGDEARPLVEELEHGLRRMSELIAQLLDLARAEAPATDTPLEPVDLGDAITAALQDVIQLAGGKKIDIGVEPFTPTAVLGDPNDVRTLLKNLFDNAVRYTPEGGVVDVFVARREATVELDVRDTGPGIPEPLFERLFDRFFRLAGPETEGSGLGLSIVRAIADRCGATLLLQNRSDQSGLVARVTFRRATDAEELKSARGAHPRADHASTRGLGESAARRVMPTPGNLAQN